jgi:hypothetical protein
MRSIAPYVLIAMLAGLTGRVVLAHEVTYKGTVIVVEATTLRVSVIDDATKKTTPMSFGVTPKTRVFRGDTLVPFAKAGIQKGERVAVTINHDEPGQKATEIRLAAAK